MSRKTLAALIAPVAAVALLAGCSGPKPGPPGRVITKDTTLTPIYHPGYKNHPGWTQLITTYYLITKDPKDGSTTRFEVSSGNYSHCYRGSSYPSCMHR